MNNKQVMIITGASKGIGKFLAEYYAKQNYDIIGCSRQPGTIELNNYRHFCLDVADEPEVMKMFAEVRKQYGRLDVVINNAGIASMNHVLLTPLSTVRKIYETNVMGTFLFSREAAKLMQKNHFGRIVNFATVATVLKLEGEAIYASSKAAIVSLTEILAREVANYGITVNAVGPTPIKTDLIRSVPEEKLNALLDRQAIRRFGEFQDVTNVIDFFLKPESNFITGQVLYLGGV
jgi:3-oxoacyl-[acyl-carrier protein] reductase